MKIETKTFRVREDRPVKLNRWPTKTKSIYKSKEDYRNILEGHIQELSARQGLLYADNRYSLLLIFQAMDAAGKDGAIKHVMSGVNPQGCQVFSFKHPSAQDLEHDFLWRTTRCLPERGRIGIFNRSYYEEVLIVRVHPEILRAQKLPEKLFNDKKFWEHRFRSINDLEKHLYRNGTRVVKIYLHLSKEEQRRRFLERIDDSEKNWKFSPYDLAERHRWHDYMKAYEDCLSATSVERAPWFIVPADDKGNARLIISQIVLDALKSLKMSTQNWQDAPQGIASDSQDAFKIERKDSPEGHPTEVKEMKISPLAGKPADPSLLVDVPKLITAYYAEAPDPLAPAQRVAFGTSGHRGTSLEGTFNENHILAITQAICLHRKQQGIDGPLFLGMDTHALSVPALTTALEVVAANGVEVMLAEGDEYTPTPAISHAILMHNRGRKSGLADGIVITPSHNPPQDGGFKYNPPNGGPAETGITNWIETKANEFLAADLHGVKRISFRKALHADTTHRHDYLTAYVSDLGSVMDMEAIRGARISLGVDPLGGAGVHYWGRIAECHGLNLTVINETVDPTFRFMTVDWDGQIRMDPSSSYAMQQLIGLKDRFDIAFACDPDHDRHGIVTRSAGLLPPNHYLAAAIFYLFQHRTHWRPEAAVGKTLVSSQMIDRVAAKVGRKLCEVPVGFKWFVGGLLDGSLGFAGEESAGATFLRLNGSVWTTDKDGIVLALLAAEMTARMGLDPAEIYAGLTRELGKSVYDRVEAPATVEQKDILKRLSPRQVRQQELAGEKITAILTRAPGNDAPIGGLKVITENGWFAARPSGTENIYKIYAESFRGTEHLRAILVQAQTIVNQAMEPPIR